MRDDHFMDSMREMFADPAVSIAIRKDTDARGTTLYRFCAYHVEDTTFSVISVQFIKIRELLP